MNPNQGRITKGIFDSLHSAFAIGIAFTFILIASGCGRSIQESKLIGSWQIDVTSRRAIVYTYQEDHTFMMAITGRKYSESSAIVGKWELQGDRLITLMQALTNDVGAEAISFAELNGTTNRITKLNDSVLVLRNPWQWNGLKLKRIVASPPASK